MKNKLQDKKLLRLESVFLTITLCMYILLVCFISIVEMQEWIKIFIISILTIYICIMAFIFVRFEQVVGCYECNECHHKYIPTYFQILFAMHIFRTRYMKCPNCKKMCWQKKVVWK